MGAVLPFDSGGTHSLHALEVVELPKQVAVPLSGTRAFEHLSQTVRRQLRQWWRRRVVVNETLQHRQVGALGSMSVGALKNILRQEDRFD